MVSNEGGGSARAEVDPELLSRRERQIVEALYELGEGGIAAVRGRMPDPPSYSAVRAMVGRLEEKGFLTHRRDGQRYVYTPTVARGSASRRALQRLVKTFYDGSVASAVHGLLGMAADGLPAEEVDRLQAILEKAKRREEPR